MEFEKENQRAYSHNLHLRIEGQTSKSDMERSWNLNAHHANSLRVRGWSWSLWKEHKKTSLQVEPLFVEGKQELTEISSFEATGAKLEAFIEGRIWW